MSDEAHQFMANVDADPLRAGRYRWTICEGVQIHLRSPQSYATQREANEDLQGHVKICGPLAGKVLTKTALRPLGVSLIPLARGKILAIRNSPTVDLRVGLWA
jgi:hypothetical protein